MYTLKLRKIRLKNFINANDGMIKITPESKIVGLYGPNGSGKTTLVKAFKCTKAIFSERNPGDDPDEVILPSSLIMIGADKATISLEWEIGTEGNLEYSFSIRRSDTQPDKANISSESLTCKGLSGQSAFSMQINKRGYKKDLEELGSQLASLASKLNGLFFSKEYSLEKLKEAYKKTRQENRSFFAHDGLFSMIEGGRDSDQAESFSNLVSDVLFSLHWYFKLMYFFSDTEEGQTRQNDRFEDFTSISSFLIYPDEFEKRGIDPGKEIKDPQKEKELRNLCQERVPEINSVLKEILPSVSLVYESDDRLLIEKEGVCIPLSAASYGEKKLIRLTKDLLEASLNERITIIIDEFDEGIFELRLKKLLCWLLANTVGMVIFTAHNLMPLEVLPPKAIWFTTVAQKKLYSTMRNIKSKTNMRDKYYRILTVGDDENPPFNYDIDSDMIATAFRIAAYRNYGGAR